MGGLSELSDFLRLIRSRRQQVKISAPARGAKGGTAIEANMIVCRGGNAWTRLDDLLSQVDVFDSFYRMPQEALSQSLKLLCGISRKKLQARRGTPFFALCRGNELHKVGCDLLRGGLGRVDDIDVARRDTLQQRFEQRVVGAPEDNSVGILKSLGESFVEIYASYLLGHRVIDPSFFDKRN